MKKIFAIFLFWFFLIVLINKLSAGFIPDRTSYELPFKVPATFTIAPLLNMDGRHYLDIACNGYFVKGGFDLRVFFPVYPLVIKAFSLNCSLNPIIVGLLISAVSFLASLYFLARMLGKDIRFKTLLLLIFFPTSFFFAAYYTESVFFLFTLLFFWFVEKKKYLAASMFAALASGTRLLGVALAPVLFYEAYRDYKKNGTVRWEVLFAPAGLILFSVYNWISTGSFLTFLTKQTYWNRPVGITAPLYGLVRQVVNVASGPQVSYDSPFVYPVILIEFAILLFFLAILYFSYRKIKTSYWIYMFVSFLIILFAGPSSFPRYTLVLFPAYIFLSERLKGIRYAIYLTVSFGLFLFMASLFLRGYWAS